MYRIASFGFTVVQPWMVGNNPIGNYDVSRYNYFSFYLLPFYYNLIFDLYFLNFVFYCVKQLINVMKMYIFMHTDLF